MTQSIVEAISSFASQHPEKVCIIDKDGELTYKDYYGKILKYAAVLEGLGIKKGDCVVIKAAQSSCYLAAFHAIHILSAVAVPLEKNVKDERLNAIATQTSAALVISDSTAEGFKTVLYSELSKGEKEYAVAAFPKSEDVSTILFTTGTTGKSKGVTCSHRLDYATAGNVQQGVGLTKDTREVIPMPLNHSFALRRYYANMITGSSVILLDGVIFVNKFFDCFDKLGANAAAMAPSALSIIFKLTGDGLGEYRDKIDFVQLGSAHLPQEDKDRLKALLPSSRLYNIYGSSEAGCACVLNFNSEDDKPYCIGKDTVNSIIAFIDEDGNIFDATEEHPGKIITGGAIIMEGYYNEEQLTRETLIDGYIHSNDLGYRDRDGLVFMLGRIDDVIISGGNKISPFEVEDLCLKYKGIVDCAVIGKKDELMGEIPVLFACVNESYSESELVTFLNHNLEAFQVPNQIIILDAIPKTFNGKALKRELKKLI